MVPVKLLFFYPKYPPYFPEGQAYICDAEGNRRLVSESKYHAAKAANKICQVRHFEPADPARAFKLFEVYRARQKFSGTMIDDFQVEGNRILLKKVYLRMGTYTIPEFVSGIYQERAISPFEDGIDLKLYNASMIIDFGELFANCENLVRLDLSQFDTSKAVTMTGMFARCLSLEHLDVSGFDTSHVASMWNMFDSCKKLKELDLRNFDTSQVATMNSMFNSCYALSKLNLSSFNVSKVCNMNGMFYGDTSLQYLDLSSFRKNKCCEMIAMFGSCRNLEYLDMRHMTILRKANISSMFKNCPDVDKYNLPSSLKYRAKHVEWAGSR